MIARLIISLLTVISILWIAVASYLQNQQTVQYKMEQLFGPEDNTLILLNQIGEYTEIKETIPGYFDWDTLLTEEGKIYVSRIIYSQSQAHALLETKDIVTEKRLQELFHGTLKVSKNTFVGPSFQGHFNLTKIYIYNNQIPENTIIWQFPALDKNASVNFLTFTGKGNLSVKDYYHRQTGKQDFEVFDNALYKMEAVNDAELFSHVLPVQIEEYHFYAKPHLFVYDPTLAKQSWLDLVESGVVITKIKGQTGVFLDARPNSDMYQLQQNSADRNSQIIAFKTNHPSTVLSNNQLLYIANLDDHYAVSANKSFCEEALAQYKLGNVLSNNLTKMASIYGALPRRVHIRTQAKTVQSAVRLVPHYELSFNNLSIKAKTEATSVSQATQNDPKHFNIGSSVKAADVDESGRIWIQDEDQNIHYFGINGKITLIEKANQLIMAPRFIYRNNQEQLLTLVHAENISMYTATGTIAFNLNAPNGTKFSSAPTFSKIRGKDFLLVGGEDGTVYWFNASSGKMEKQSKVTNRIPVTEVSFWTSAGKHFIGAQAQTTFYMLNAETNKLFRNFSLGKVKGSQVVQNDFKQIVHDASSIKIFNQKGGSIQLPKTSGMVTVQVLSHQKGLYIAYDGGHRFVVFNIHGEIVNDRSFNEINFDQFAATYDVHKQQVIIATLDNLNNRIRLHNLTTNQSNLSSEFNGSHRVLLTSNGKTVFLYTLIDNILIRYDQ